jgi:hypothetical protein
MPDFTMDEVADEVRSYFEKSRSEYADTRRRPDEFTRSMYQAAMGISMQEAVTVLTRKVKEGELVERRGFDASGKPCILYKVVIK